MSGARIAVRAWALGLAAVGLVACGQLMAQGLNGGVNKTTRYVQSGPHAVAENNNGTAHAFSVYVQGSNVASLAPPTLSGPFDPSAFNGTLTYSAAQSSWNFNASYGTAAELDARFGNGAYTLTVNGTAIPLQLVGNLYSNPPLATLTGGQWQNGVYYFDPAQPLTITTNVSSVFSTGMGGMFLGWGLGSVGQSYVESSTGFLTATVPANTFSSGQEYQVSMYFSSDTTVNTTALPGTYFAASYISATTLRLVAQAAPQPFPLTVNANITPTVSTVTANMQFQPQDVGTTGSVYSFFVAPKTKVANAATMEKGAYLGGMKAKGTEKAVAVECVLAQLNSQGQLQGVSAANLQAYVTGVLSGQGQAVSMVNNLPTANIAGATLYLGYAQGTDPLAMITKGTNRRATKVSGEIQCDPQAPQTGWWWNKSEGGRGYSIEVAGNHIFYAAYLYDTNGRATWYVASGPVWLDNSVFPGNLEAYASGQTLSGAYKAPGSAVLSGPITLAFTDSQTGTMTWPGGTVAIERFEIVPQGLKLDPLVNQPESGWWWNPSESGRGYFLEWQGGQLFMAGYMYDDNGNPIWYLSSNTSTNLQTYTSVWQQYANGQTLTGAFKPASQVNANVGAVSIQFQGSENAIMTLPGGRTTNISRLPF